MNDLISRQAAFDIVENIRDRMSVEGYWAIVERLKHLPSAQPEVIRCKDCRWWDKYDEKHGYCMAAKHGFMSSHWEISIYRTYDEEFFCADAEPKEIMIRSSSEGRRDE